MRKSLIAFSLVACTALFISGCAHSSKTGEVDAASDCASECAMSKEECATMKAECSEMKSECSSKKACSSMGSPE